jgi:RNA recognition motif-containing protein
MGHELSNFASSEQDDSGFFLWLRVLLSRVALHFVFEGMAMEALGQPQQSYGEVQQFQQSMDPSMGSVSGEPQNNNLIVNYIPNNLTEVDLRNLFTPYGQVVHCKLVMDKVTGKFHFLSSRKPSGFCFQLQH